MSIWKANGAVFFRRVFGDDRQPAGLEVDEIKIPVGIGWCSMRVCVPLTSAVWVPDKWLESGNNYVSFDLVFSDVRELSVSGGLPQEPAGLRLELSEGLWTAKIDGPMRLSIVCDHAAILNMVGYMRSKAP